LKKLFFSSLMHGVVLLFAGLVSGRQVLCSNTDALCCLDQASQNVGVTRTVSEMRTVGRTVFPGFIDDGEGNCLGKNADSRLEWYDCNDSSQAAKLLSTDPSDENNLYSLVVFDDCSRVEDTTLAYRVGTKQDPSWSSSAVYNFVNVEPDVFDLTETLSKNICFLKAGNPSSGQTITTKRDFRWHLGYEEASVPETAEHFFLTFDGGQACYYDQTSLCLSAEKTVDNHLINGAFPMWQDDWPLPTTGLPLSINSDQSVTIFPNFELRWTKGCLLITAEPYSSKLIVKDIVTDAPSTPPTSLPTTDPTVAPSSQPTTNPTADPTAQPTAYPTPDPSSLPTSDPTSLPTTDPTANPSPNPTASPSPGPTAEPTPKPSPSPTSDPTANPTSDPTTQPSAQPTSDPTANPSASPTPGPTSDPTVTPTANPTPKPSTNPTANPTSEPTPNPTSEPSRKPTAGPTSNDLAGTEPQNNGLEDALAVPMWAILIVVGLLFLLVLMKFVTCRYKLVKKGDKPGHEEKIEHKSSIGRGFSLDDGEDGIDFHKKTRSPEIELFDQAGSMKGSWRGETKRYSDGSARHSSGDTTEENDDVDHHYAGYPQKERKHSRSISRDSISSLHQRRTRTSSFSGRHRTVQDDEMSDHLGPLPHNGRPRSGSVPLASRRGGGMERGVIRAKTYHERGHLRPRPRQNPGRLSPLSSPGRSPNLDELDEDYDWAGTSFGNGQTRFLGNRGNGQNVLRRHSYQPGYRPAGRDNAGFRRYSADGLSSREAILENFEQSPTNGLQRGPYSRDDRMRRHSQPVASTRSLDIQLQPKRDFGGRRADSAQRSKSAEQRYLYQDPPDVFDISTARGYPADRPIPEVAGAPTHQHRGWDLLEGQTGSSAGPDDVMPKRVVTGAPVITAYELTGRGSNLDEDPEALSPHGLSTAAQMIAEHNTNTAGKLIAAVKLKGPVLETVEEMWRDESGSEGGFLGLSRQNSAESYMTGRDTVRESVDDEGSDVPDIPDPNTLTVLEESDGDNTVLEMEDGNEEEERHSSQSGDRGSGKRTRGPHQRDLSDFWAADPELNEEASPEYQRSPRRLSPGGSRVMSSRGAQLEDEEQQPPVEILPDDIPKRRSSGDHSYVLDKYVRKIPQHDDIGLGLDGVHNSSYVKEEVSDADE